MEQDEVALIKAIESGESELGTLTLRFAVLTGVFTVLQQLRKKLPLAQFFRAVNDKPAASQLFESWAKNHDQELLKDFYYQDDRKSASAGILIQESLESTVRPISPSLTPRC
jgi:vacuolar protein sorting-associated protein 16